MNNNTELIEKELFLEAVFKKYGYDFRQYSSSSIIRRIRSVMEKESIKTISALQERTLHDRDCMERFLKEVSINVTSMFRDAAFFKSFREKVVPMLRTYPFIRIWVAGCSSGEEVYSIAIILEEEGLYERSRIYATDISPEVLKSAQDAIFPLAKMKDYTSNYQKAGGKSEFSQYYIAQYENAILKASLKKNLIFAKHNLVSDSSFNEFNIIFCRNVMIYFNGNLQSKVFQLFHDSLCNFGVLALGKKESLRFSPVAEQYEDLDLQERLFRRVQ